MFGTYIVEIIDLDGKAFPMRIAPDCCAGPLVCIYKNLPKGGRWLQQELPNKIGINGVEAQTCFANQEIILEIRPNEAVRQKLKNMMP
jgi:hypothetical protein